MQVGGHTVAETSNLFNANLTGLISELDTKKYVVKMLVEYVYKRQLPIGEEELDSVKIARLFESGSSELLDVGDSYLFLCGWFPEYVSRKRRKSMGLGFYIKKGVESYNYALSLVHQRQIDYSPSLLSKLSDSFADNIIALIGLKVRLRNQKIAMHPEVYDEFRSCVGDGISPFIDGMVDRELLNNETSIEQRIAKSGLTLIKGGGF